MNADIITLAIILLVALGFALTKTHIAFVTLALCAGYVLSVEVGPGLVEFINSSIESADGLPIFTAVSLILMLFPALLIGYRFRRSQKGGGRLLQQLIPALALSLMLVIFVFDFLPEDVQAKVAGDAYFYGQLELLRGWIILFAIASALFDIVIQHGGVDPGKKKDK